MNKERREIVIPSQFLGKESDNLKAGNGTFRENGNIYANVVGIINQYKNIINVVPLLTSLSALIVPPCASTSCLVIANPSLLLPFVRARDLSPRQKRLKM